MELKQNSLRNTSSRAADEDCNAHLTQARSAQLVLAFVSTLFVMAIGCTKSPEIEKSTSEAPEVSQSVDNFGIFVDVLSKLDEYEPRSAQRKMLLNLNQWAVNAKPDPDWKPDDLIKRLPDRFGNLQELKELDNLRCTQKDVEYLRQSAWMRDVAKWATAPSRDAGFGLLIDQAKSSLDKEERQKFERSPDRLTAALAMLDKSLDPADAAKLATCIRLFDWTISNIQLDKMLPRRQQNVGPSSTNNATIESLAIPGPGYQNYPWQTLLFGHGDALARARVFIHLARQANVEVVMVGHDENQRTSRAIPWVPAANINEQLYLFDTALGIPIPGKDTPVATLEQLVDDPSLLRKLDVEYREEKFAYPVSEKELKQIVVMVAAPPQSLSQRMLLIEKGLAGENKMVLTTRPRQSHAEILEYKGVNQVGIWTVPIETIFFRNALRQMISQEKLEAIQYYFRYEYLFDNSPFTAKLGYDPLVRARQQFFEGEMDDLNGKVGAKTLYLEARISDDIIRRVLNDEKLQKEFGFMLRDDMDDQLKQSYGLQFQQSLATSKAHSGFWLAMTHFERGDFAQAAQWLQRARRLDEMEIWKPGVNYNLARCYEAMGDIKEAQSMLRKDKTHQRYGSLLRARMLLDYL